MTEKTALSTRAEARRPAAGFNRLTQAQKIYLAARPNLDATLAELIVRRNVGARWIATIGHGSLDTWLKV